MAASSSSSLDPEAVRRRALAAAVGVPSAIPHIQRVDLPAALFAATRGDWGLPDPRKGLDWMVLNDARISQKAPALGVE